MATEICSPNIFVGTQPSGWADTAIPKYLKYYSGADEQLLRQRQVQRWVDKTGEHPSVSRFTLIVPVHNEQYSLPSFLATLALSDIPSEVRKQIVFITNACTDQSPAIINHFLKSVGGSDVTEEVISNNEKFWVTTSDNTEYIHLNTSVPGKANALSIGNELAVNREDKIAISVDSDVYPEPDTIKNMYAAAIYRFQQDYGGTVLLSATPKITVRPSWLKSLWGKVKPSTSVLQIFGKKGNVYGWNMAWDTEWLKSVGGFPKVANEDYALGVVARLNGKRIGYVPDANIWGYQPNNARDIFESRARSKRCVMQLERLYPGAEEIMRSDKNFAYFNRRLYLFMESIQNKPQYSPFYIANFIFQELATLKGVLDYYRAPSNQSWSQIKSAR